MGLLLGPLVGSGLYELGGYSCPFFTLGSIFALMLPLLIKMLTIAEEGVARRTGISRMDRQEIEAVVVLPTAD